MVIFSPRASPGSPPSIVVPGAASGVHDVLQRVLLPLLCRCSGAAAMNVLQLCCSAAAAAAAAAADMSAMCFRR